MAYGYEQVGIAILGNWTEFTVRDTERRGPVRACFYSGLHGLAKAAAAP